MSTAPPDASSGPTSGPPPGPAGPDTGPRVSGEEMRDLARLRRVHSDRKIAGVAGGVARHFDIDPIIPRVALVVLTFFAGVGIVLYAVCWLIVPDEVTGDSPIRLDERSRAVALLILGGLSALALLGESLGGWSFPWPLSIIAVAVLLLLLLRRGRTDRPLPPPSSYAPVPPIPPVPTATAATGGSTSPPPVAAYPTYQPPAAPVPPAGPVPPPRPRRGGPLLFGYAVALSVVAAGVLGMVDLAGADVPAGAYPAAVVAVSGVLLVVGAFLGRPGGLIALGLIASVATLGATVADEVDAGQVRARPAVAADLHDSYRVTAGEVVLDLRDVSDLESLDGRTVRLHATFGRVHVIVPEQGLDVVVRATIHNGGETDLFGRDSDGDQDATHDGGARAPLVTIDADVSFGQIDAETRSTR